MISFALSKSRQPRNQVVVDEATMAQNDLEQDDAATQSLPDDDDDVLSLYISMGLGNSGEKNQAARVTGWGSEIVNTHNTMHQA